MSVVRTGRWNGALAAAVVITVLGLLLGLPALFVLAVVPLGFALLAQLETAPEDALRIERTLDREQVRPGESVSVTLSVTNEGDAVVPDARLVDQPPALASVTTGSPAFATPIRPGETVSWQYELTPPRGEFSFEPTRIRLRSVLATTVRTIERDPDGDDAFSCATLLDSFPLRDRTVQYVGRTPTDDGGSGIEFFSTREYRRGDPINRIDWHRLARTGELATVEYRSERAVTTVFVIDDRSGIHRIPPGGGPDSYDLCLYAAARGVVASIEEGNRTGLLTLADDVQVEPGVGDDVRRRVETELGLGLGLRLGADKGDESAGAERDTQRTSAPAEVRTDGGRLAASLERRLPPRAQMVLCTPLTDDRVVELLRTLRVYGRAVTAVSPDVTSGPGTADLDESIRLARIERTNRITSLRGAGIAVIDWNLDAPLSIELVRAMRYGGGSP